MVNLRAPLFKALATKSEVLSLIIRIHMVLREKQLLQVIFFSTHMHTDRK